MWLAISRTVLADVPGWAVIEDVDEPSAITTPVTVEGPPVPPCDK
jgi:pyridoxal 5-phosphate dependent beta-lyase